jgi:hypothetical protein
VASWTAYALLRRTKMPQAPCRYVSAGPSSMPTPLLWSIFDLSFHLRLVFFEAILNHVPASLCRATTRFHWVCAMKNEQFMMAVRYRMGTSSRSVKQLQPISYATAHHVLHRELGSTITKCIDCHRVNSLTQPFDWTSCAFMVGQKSLYL